MRHARSDGNGVAVEIWIRAWRPAFIAWWFQHVGAVARGGGVAAWDPRVALVGARGLVGLIVDGVRAELR